VRCAGTKKWHQKIRQTKHPSSGLEWIQFGNNCIHILGFGGYSMAKKSWRKKGLLLALIGSIVIAVFLVLKPGSSSVEQVQAEKNTGFTSDVLQFEDIAFQLTSSSHGETEQIFHFTIENISNVEVSTQSTSFTIKNEGNIYSSWSLEIAENRLNPGMSTTATVTFRMKDSYLMEGEPLMIIKRGIFFPTVMQFELDKAS
jgi:hypothetical protein